MQIHEQFQLKFRKIKRSDGSIFFHCEYRGNIRLYMFAATLLNMIDTDIAEIAIERIEVAENNADFDPENEDFDAYIGPEVMADGYDIKIVPPNIVTGLDDGYQIPMTDWKQLMQEWRDFLLS